MKNAEAKELLEKFQEWYTKEYADIPFSIESMYQFIDTIPAQDSAGDTVSPFGVLLLNPNEKWVSVEERLPEPEVEVLIIVAFKFGNRNPYRMLGELDHQGNWWVNDENGIVEWSKSVAVRVDYFEITHWMPLPKSPTTK